MGNANAPFPIGLLDKNHISYPLRVAELTYKIYFEEIFYLLVDGYLSLERTIPPLLSDGFSVVIGIVCGRSPIHLCLTCPPTTMQRCPQIP